MQYSRCPRRCQAREKPDRFRNRSLLRLGTNNQASDIQEPICLPYIFESSRNVPVHVEVLNCRFLTSFIDRANIAARTKQTSEFAAPRKNQYPCWPQFCRRSTGRLERAALYCWPICLKAYAQEKQDQPAGTFIYLLRVLVFKRAGGRWGQEENGTRTNGLSFCETPS